MKTARRLLAIALVSTCTPLLAAEPQGQCQENFSVAGSYSSGKTFKTSAEHPGVSYAMRRLSTRSSRRSSPMD